MNNFTRLSLLSVLLRLIWYLTPSSWGCGCTIAATAATAEHSLLITDKNTSRPSMGGSTTDERHSVIISATKSFDSKKKHIRRLPSIPSQSESSSPPCCCRCCIYIWDILSYLKYHHVQSQSKQYIIEGKGGKKFIRIPPNSILKIWYPQLLSGALKTNSCWLCGYSWQDHLRYWWDCRKRSGNVEVFDRFMSRSSASGGGAGNISNAFYKQYVNEVVVNEQDSKNRQIISRSKKNSEIRHTLDGRVSFMVPRFDPLAKHNGDNGSGSMMSLGSLLLLALARIQSLAKVEELIWLDNVESFRQAARRQH